MTDFAQYAQDVIAGKKPHEGAAIAQMLEDEIERRGLRMQYIDALLARIATSFQAHTRHGELWAVIRATPEQRAQAFLEAAKAMEVSDGRTQESL